jgi:hypothetical protein
MQLQSSENAIDYQTDKQTDGPTGKTDRNLAPDNRTENSKGEIAIGTRKKGDNGPTKKGIAALQLYIVGRGM